MSDVCLPEWVVAYLIDGFDLAGDGGISPFYRYEYDAVEAHIGTLRKRLNIVQLRKARELELANRRLPSPNQAQVLQAIRDLSHSSQVSSSSNGWPRITYDQAYDECVRRGHSFAPSTVRAHVGKLVEKGWLDKRTEPGSEHRVTLGLVTV